MIPIYASALPRISKCSASAKLQHELPDRIPSTEDAVAGTERHAEIEQYIKSGGTYVPEDSLVLQAVEHLKTITDVKNLEAEVKVKSEFLGSNVIVDAVDRKNKIIIDFKFGYQEVEVDGNMQLLAGMQALGFDPHVPTTFVIIQPRVESPVKTIKVNAEYVRARWAELKTIVNNARAPQPQYNVGRHCMLCPARHRCGAINDAQKGLTDYVEAKRAELDLTDFELGQELTIVHELMDIVTARKSALTAIAEHKLREGGAVPGWGMQRSRGRRVFKDAQAAAEFIKSQGVDPYKSEMKSPAEVEKEIKKSILKEHVESIPGRTKLAPEPTAAQLLSKGAKL